MPGYETLTSDVRIGAYALRLRSLSDRMQFADPDGDAARVGICSASWPLFGVLWPAAIPLAEAMSETEIDGLRFLEVGCGLGLPSLVLKRRNADITASDHHPLAETFLRYNAELNGIPPVNFVQMRWAEPAPDLGRFDVIIGSDILYERGHAEMLAQVVEEHSEACGEVWISCPGRGHLGRFSRALRAQGFRATEYPRLSESNEKPPFKGRLLRFVRGDRRPRMNRPSRFSPRRQPFDLRPVAAPRFRTRVRVAAASAATRRVRRP